jgi:L-ascorbate metabolism protein UlaG (beta-lactamase superfamily)
MKIIKLPQAGMIVSCGDTKIICDPLVNGFTIESIFEVAKGYKLDKRALRKIKFAGLVISHHHGDHFHLESLACLNRDTPVYYPKGSVVISEQLKLLGFSNLIELKPGRSYKIGSLELVPIKSRVSFPEVGYIVKSDEHTLWNFVDSQPSPKDIDKMKKKFGRPDVLFAYYQCMNETGVSSNNLPNEFPGQQYQKFLDYVRRANPKCLVPSSCDLYYASGVWLNSYMYPISKEAFIADIKKCDSRIIGVAMEPGESYELKRHKLKKIKSPIPDLKISASSPQRFPWQPDIGKRKVVDHQPLVKTLAAFKNEVNKFLDGTFQKMLSQQPKHPTADRFSKEKVIWKLRLVCPDQSEIVRHLDFSRSPLKWMSQKEMGKFLTNKQPGIESIVGAGDLLAFANGHLDIYAFYSGGYGAHISRHYKVENWKVKTIEYPDAEFIPGLFMGKRAWLLHLHNRLKKLDSSL